MSLNDLPDEIVEQIYLNAFPSDFVALASTSRRYHDLLHKPPSQYVWRTHFLQRFDDPCACVDKLGLTLASDWASFDWKAELQRRIRAQCVVLAPPLCRAAEVRDVLRTLVSMIEDTPPATPAYATAEISKNLLWLSAQHALPDFLRAMHRRRALPPAEERLLHKLHVLFGLAPDDLRPEQVARVRGFVYDFRNRTQESRWGPYEPAADERELDDDLSARVNWRHVFAVQNIMAEHVSIFEEDEEHGRRLKLLPLSLPFCQAHITNEPSSHKLDWAGVEGSWKCSFCFIDHVDLLEYNRDTVPKNEERDLSLFKDPGFEEVFRLLDLRFTVLHSAVNPLFPTRPTLFFNGDVKGTYIMRGSVSMTAEKEVRWRFMSGEEGNLIWSSDGVQIGSVGSTFGVLGTWTTVFHDEDDPIGPFWLRKVHRDTDTEDENETWP